MDKKYQVFVSSTYKDLIDERNEVMKALLELDCIPTGMELFPSSDDDQMTYIKKVIDNCDYYILILGGRYGELHSSGKSYTQLEYEYAIEKEIPIIAFLHADPSSIPVSKTESASRNKKKLLDFRIRAEKKLCRYWNNSNELGALVGRSLVKLIKEKPQKGWIKAENTTEKNEGDIFETIFKEVLTIKDFLQIPKVSPTVKEFDYIRKKLEDESEKIELEIIKIMYIEDKSETPYYCIVLEEAITRRKISVVIGTFEAQAIAISMDKISTPRPLTHDLFVSLTQKTNIEIKEIIIDFFQVGIYYSKIILKISSVLVEIDSRTSDAIAIAIRTGAPIYTLSSTFEKAYLSYKVTDDDLIKNPEKGTDI